MMSECRETSVHEIKGTTTYGIMGALVGSRAQQIPTTCHKRQERCVVLHTFVCFMYTDHNQKLGSVLLPVGENPENVWAID